MNFHHLAPKASWYKVGRWRVAVTSHSVFFCKTHSDSSRIVETRKPLAASHARPKKKQSRGFPENWALPEFYSEPTNPTCLHFRNIRIQSGPGPPYPHCLSQCHSGRHPWPPPTPYKFSDHLCSVPSAQTHLISELSSSASVALPLPSTSKLEL